MKNLESLKCRIVPVKVQGRSDTFHVREFDLTGFSKWAAALSAAHKERQLALTRNLPEPETDLRSLALALSVCNEKGDLEYTLDEIKNLMELNGRVIAELWMACAELNCLMPTQEEVERAGDFFTRTPPSSPSQPLLGIFARLIRWLFVKRLAGKTSSTG